MTVQTGAEGFAAVPRATVILDDDHAEDMVGAQILRPSDEEE